MYFVIIAHQMPFVPLWSRPDNNAVKASAIIELRLMVVRPEELWKRIAHSLHFTAPLASTKKML